MTIRRWIGATLICMLGSATILLAESSWPQWRGPERNGFDPGKAWPTTLTADTLTKKWRVELDGPSFSGPVITGGTVFVTQTVREKTEHVLALDLATGKKKWEAQWEGAMRVSPIGESAGSWIRATPATDGQSLFVLGMRDVLVALDVKTGQELWRVDFPKDYNTPIPDFGGVSSPLVSGDFVFAQAGSGLAKLDKKTGKVLWRSLTDGPGKSKNGAFSSPVLATIDGTAQLLVQTREELAALSPDDGRILWRTKVPALFGMNITTPAVSGKTVFTSATNGSLLIAATQMSAAETRPATAPATQAADLQPGAVVWRSTLVGYMSSPIVRDGHAYLHLRNQRLACINLATGQRTWITQPAEEYWSMAAQDNRILSLSNTGTLRLLEVSPTAPKMVGEVPLIKDEENNQTWAHVAVVDNEIIIRDLKGVTVYTWK